MLQQGLVIGSLAAVLACLWFWGASAPLWAAAGVFLLLCWSGLQLGLQMLLMRRFNRKAGVPPVAWRTQLAVWRAEWALALQVFAWRQPFRTQAEADAWPQAPDSGQVGVVLVHGFFCNRAFWAPWLRRFKHEGIPCAAVTLEPARAPIDAMVPALDAMVRRMVAATGKPALLVAHSMGGLVVRAWLQGLAPAQRQALVAHVVTLATPHQGTWLAHWVGQAPVSQMQPGNAWLQQLAPVVPGLRWSNWYSECDNIVFPAPLARLPGSENHVLRDVAHVQLAMDPRVFLFCLRAQQDLRAAAPAAACGPD